MTSQSQTESLNQTLQTDLGRIALALDRLEHAASAREAEMTEMAALKARHRRLKDTVSNELQQLDLLLANLPQKP
jgi:predicted  nucleic acid-binding Zn-ribbon protein